jgi:hypothetical protein
VTRQSIPLADNAQTGWMRGSSPRMTGEKARRKREAARGHRRARAKTPKRQFAVQGCAKALRERGAAAIWRQ